MHAPAAKTIPAVVHAVSFGLYPYRPPREESYFPRVPPECLQDQMTVCYHLIEQLHKRPKSSHMPRHPDTTTYRVFYSYCHADAKYKDGMQKHLSHLKQQGLIKQWHDGDIIPGQRITPEIRRHLDGADIVVFLFSPDFIDSTACMQEWDYARSLVQSNPSLRRIPIILRACAWKDVLGNDDLMALPKNGRPIERYTNPDEGWQQVYEGIKKVIDDLGSTVDPKPDFLGHIDRSEFISQNHLKLRDLYVFPELTHINIESTSEAIEEQSITNRKNILANSLNLIHGQDRIGKTALARHLYLDMIDNSEPVLLVDLAQSTTGQPDRIFRRAFNEQFHGDYAVWSQHHGKTLIIDNLSETKHSLDVINSARDVFENILAITPSDIFYSYFKDEPALSDFRQLRIAPFSLSQQETLIRKHLQITNVGRKIPDGLVDQVEGHINSIIISKHILPRYPFYILSILQTREAYMPGNMSITSYGHCYHALIVANLIKSGISERDDAVNACFNFAEQLAFATFESRKKEPKKPLEFDRFLESYHARFFIRRSFINRLKNPTFGIIDQDGGFRSDYMYYYFLGKYLSRNMSKGNAILAALCENSHKEANYLTLLFTIHHTNDDSLIDDILLRTMCTLDSVTPATLSREQTKRFSGVIAELPQSILSAQNVESARKEQRNKRGDATEEADDVNDDRDDDEMDEVEIVNGIYKILKNNKIMAQVLRNRYGSLEKSRVEEIVEVISESGLRLVNLILADDEQIGRLARYYHKKNPDWDLAMIRKVLAHISFIWTMINVEEVVSAINVPEIGGAVESVVVRKDTPAYDIIGYFRELDSTHELTKVERDSLSALRKKHKDLFVQRVASIRTQHYMNTHRSSQRVEQSICDLLRIKYIPRALRGS